MFSSLTEAMTASGIVTGSGGEVVANCWEEEGSTRLAPRRTHSGHGLADRGTEHPCEHHNHNRSPLRGAHWLVPGDDRD